MKRHAFTDAEGWVVHVRQAEGPPIPGEAAIPLTPEEVHPAHQSLGALRHGEDGFEMPQDDPTLWKALRRQLPGYGAHAALEALRGHRAVFTRDVTVAVADPPPLMAIGAPAAATFEVPGLTIEPITSAHLSDIAQIAVDSGLYPATCPPSCGQCVPPEAHTWLQLAARIDSPHAWQLMTAYQGRPLQYELIGFDPLRTMGLFNITFHANRERPAWFWREAAQPVFQRMAAIGVRRIESRTRADRPDWIQSLKDNYGAQEFGLSLDGSVMQLGFPLDLTRFTGWPARKVVGLDLTVGAVQVREATEADRPAVRALALQVPAGRRALARRLADERWDLDRASILLGFVGGTLRHARAIRLRGGTRAGLTNLSALQDDPSQDVMYQAVVDWTKRAGYTDLSTFVPTRLLTQPEQQKDLQRAKAVPRGPERVFDGEPHTEMVVPLA